MRIRRTANGTEVWDAIRKEWRPTSHGQATMFLSNSLFPKTYRSKPKPIGLTRVEIRAGKGGNQ